MNRRDRRGEPDDTTSHALAASSGQGVFRLDSAGRVAYVDSRAADIFGYLPKEMQGRHFAEYNNEADLPQVQANFAQRRLGIGGVTEYRMRCKNGALRWLAVASVPTHDVDGAFFGVTGFVTDIDELKRQQEMSGHERRLLRQIAGNYPLAAVLEDLCQTLEAVSRRPLHAAVMLADRDSLKCVAAPGLPPRFRKDRAVVRLDEDASPCAQAVRSGNEVIVRDTVQAEAAECRTYGFGAVWSYPIVQEEKILGTLALFLPAPGEPDAEDVHAIGFALQVARLALAHERKAAALRDSEQRFRDYAELSADWYWEQDADFRFTYMSGGVFNKGGYRVSDSVGKARWELPIESVSEAQWAEHRALLERRECFHDFTYAVRVADGTQHWYSISGKPVFAADGEFLGYRGTGSDITEQVRSREKLEKTLSWLEQAVRAAGMGLWERDLATWNFSFRDNWRALFGYAEDEIEDTAEDFDRLIHPDDLARIHAAGRAYVANPQREYEVRFRVRHKDGSWRWVLSRGNVLTDVATGRGAFVGCHLDITEQMRNAEALQASEQRFHDFADLAADWFWEQDANLRFTAMYGGSGHESPGTLYTSSDTIGRHAWELPYAEAPEGFWDAHRQLLAAHQAFADLPLGYRKPDGSMRYVLVSGKPIFDGAGGFTGYRGVGHDITEQVASREKLEKTQRWLEQAVRAGSIGLWERDADTWAFGSTKNWKSLFGYAEDEIGSSAEDFDRLVHPDDLERIHAVARTYADNPHGEYESRFRIRHKDGSWRWVLSRSNVLTDAATGERTWMGSHVDITDQMLAEQQITELAAMLETRVKARTAELEEANRELDAFNFSVSHDLRTPLRAIEGFSRALLEDCDEQLDATGREYLRRICKSTARMGELIDALYGLSRMTREPLRLSPVDLSAMAHELVAELREQYPQRAVVIEIAETPLVEGDSRLLRIVLANLIGNAWKFTGKAMPARIDFDARRGEDGRVIYFLRDNGVGFDMQFADKLFRVFHRLHREEEFPGQGVGLTTVQRIVARHGGHVWGEAERGAGATFYFTLWADSDLLADAQANIENPEVEHR